MALYNFTDTQGTPSVRGLPSEAVSINGTFIENSIEGYTTISTTGRELIGKELSSEVIGASDGAFFDYSRIPDRVITVRFKLEAETSQEFREKFNQLNKILNVEQAQLIFNDELDKYFTGTLQEIEDVPDGLNTVNGSFTFYCADPYKYALDETVVQAAAGESSIMLTNDGTGSAFVNAKVTMKDDNGYVGLVLGDRVFQQGLVEQPDEVTKQKSQTLMDAKQFSSGSTTVSGVVPITGNNAITPNATYGKNGTLAVQTFAVGDKAIKAITLPTSPPNVAKTTYGGGLLMWTIPADQNGHVGATSFRFNWRLWFETATIQESANIVFYLVSTTGTAVASMHFDKTSNNNNHSAVSFIVGNKLVKRFSFDPSLWSKITNFPAGAMSIQKQGDLFTFKYPLGVATYREASLATVECNRITLFIGRANSTFKRLMTRRYVRDFNFIKDNVDYVEDIPNFFSAGDIWELDSVNNKSMINTLPTGIMRDIASRPLLLPTGTYEIALGVSDFATIPDWEVSFRKRWL